jgi:hypothetical protein
MSQLPQIPQLPQVPSIPQLPQTPLNMLSSTPLAGTPAVLPNMQISAFNTVGTPAAPTPQESTSAANQNLSNEDKKKLKEDAPVLHMVIESTCFMFSCTELIAPVSF